MTTKQIILLVTFMESIATILVERGIYFYTEKFYHFEKIHNLLLAFLFGLFYAGAAVTTERISSRFGEKRTLLAIMLLHIPMLVLFQAGNSSMLILGTIFSAILYGFKWPIIESFMMSGDTPNIAIKSIGRFNVSWSCSVPIALLIAGRLIDINHWALFAVSGIITLISIVFVTLLPPKPTHLSEDHPERPVEETLSSYRSLLTASRWLMFCSYCFLWTLAAILPIIFNRMQVSVTYASPLSSIIDVMRATMFVLCQFWTAWHGRKMPLVLIMAGLPLGFVLAMFGANIPVIILGEIVFGLSAGMCYYAALYYAMVIKNASVEAGGAHEGVIGMGFAVGPMLTAIGFWLGTAWKSEILGIMVGVSPLIILCTFKTTKNLINKVKENK
ncbi:MAG: MFS transporter [Kiritimatiellae bacterium]|nr:MFS transporter [Kiritimatiellia bacterium]MDD5522588.1 MFS transporter [Kiritimatiellia bacterium]